MELGIGHFGYNIRKSFIQPEDIILDNFDKGLLTAEEVCKSMDLLEKAVAGQFGMREAGVGEVRERAAGKFVKTIYGWKPISDKEKATKQQAQPRIKEEKDDAMDYAAKIKALKDFEGIEEIYAMFKRTGKFTEEIKRMIDDLLAKKRRGVSHKPKSSKTNTSESDTSDNDVSNKNDKK